MDPLEILYKFSSPFAFAFNTPTSFVDYMGEYPILVINYQTKTVIIYQPVFVVTEGDGALSIEKINQLNHDFHREYTEVAEKYVASISGTNEEWNFSVVFIFYAGGTEAQAIKLASSQASIFGVQDISGTWQSFDSYESYRKKYLEHGGDKYMDVVLLGGHCNSSQNVVMNSINSKLREEVHEADHLLYGIDHEGGIMSYTDAFGVGPMISKDNLSKALVRAQQQKGNIIIIEENGNLINNRNGGMNQIYSLPTFELIDRKPKSLNHNSKPTTSGMGSLFLNKNDIKSDLGLENED